VHKLYFKLLKTMTAPENSIVFAALLMGVVCCAAVPATALAEQSQDPILAVGDGFFANDANTASYKPIESKTNRELFITMAKAVVFLAILGVAAVYTVKKFLPAITNAAAKDIRITETVNLGQRRALHIVVVGDRRILIASCPEHITMLADVTNASYQPENQTDLIEDGNVL